jgi:hypothetical protein
VYFKAEPDVIRHPTKPYDEMSIGCHRADATLSSVAEIGPSSQLARKPFQAACCASGKASHKIRCPRLLREITAELCKQNIQRETKGPHGEVNGNSSICCQLDPRTPTGPTFFCLSFKILTASMRQLAPEYLTARKRLLSTR